MEICVIGVGSIGQHHARILSELPGVKLVGVVDENMEAARAIAHRYGTRPFGSLESLLSSHHPVAAVIAVPTAQHLQVACDLIKRGIHILVEKPIALDLHQADQIIDLAKQYSVFVAVGHVERFNPAVLALKSRLHGGEIGKIFHIETCRQGPFPAHVRDVGVVMDLAVHDLDLIRLISEQEIDEVSAVTARRLHATCEDFVRGTVRLSQGAIGTLTIDWLTPTKIREISVTGERGMFRVDLLTQDLYFFENSAIPSQGWASLEALRGISEGRMIRYVVMKKEPLRAELEAFVTAIRESLPVAVTGEDGRFALALAQAMIASGHQGGPVSTRDMHI